MEGKKDLSSVRMAAIAEKFLEWVNEKPKPSETDVWSLSLLQRLSVAKSWPIL